MAAYLLRLSGQVLSAIVAGMSLFRLYYSGNVYNPNVVWVLTGDALIWSGLATVIVYCKQRCLD
jgi:hypothetical protein